ncbi:MAG: response regulator [Rhodospirillales bacterium]|nr:response regulator [Alphaproteobacteria bacterium]MBL6948256.1 response regulator [Rhodospirillales bacterium]
MKKVLLVDDEPLIRQFLKLHFETGGYQVSEAENGRDALDRAASEMPDLIVMDMNMPVMTGWDAAKALKKPGAATAGIPIIALTAQKTTEDQTAAHEAGCDTFVDKPIDAERLFKAVERVLS